MIDIKTEYGISSLDDRAVKKESKRAYKININGRDIFIKILDDENIYAELIAVEIEDILRIPRVDTAIGTLNGKMYLLSYASYEERIEYIKGSFIFSHYAYYNKTFIEDNRDYHNDVRGEGSPPSKDDFNSLHTIWNAIESYIRINNIKDASVPDILNTLVNQLLFCCINDMGDLHSCNWALLHKDNSLKLYPRYDNDILVKYFRSPYEKRARSCQIRIYDQEYFLNMDELLYKFLMVSGSEYFDRVFAMLNSILSVGIENIVLRVEEKWGIKIDNKETFISNYSKRLDDIQESLMKIRKKLMIDADREIINKQF